MEEQTLPKAGQAFHLQKVFIYYLNIEDALVV